MVDLTKQYDVLVVGGGNAALCAAIAARRDGASVLVLEGAPRFYRGGNTRHTRNIRCAHDAATETLVRCLFTRPFLIVQPKQAPALDPNSMRVGAKVQSEHAWTGQRPRSSYEQRLCYWPIAVVIAPPATAA